MRNILYKYNKILIKKKHKNFDTNSKWARTIY